MKCSRLAGGDKGRCDPTEGRDEIVRNDAEEMDGFAQDERLLLSVAGRSGVAMASLI